jgi:hypothetical protein
MFRKIRKERREKNKYREQRDELEFKSTHGSGIYSANGALSA